MDTNVTFKVGQHRVGIIQGTGVDHPVEFEVIRSMEDDFDTAWEIVDFQGKQWGFSEKWRSIVVEEGNFAKALWQWYGEEVAKKALTPAENPCRV
jgi:hypothetical protein